ncbi:DUF202 domain-containing protein [Streptomyces sp. NPDC048182]|uniref:DUF202 domain-containing protein n=1 Tax=unclassified Streptomyces TaxID=2593676 RepID=UPI0033B46E51
MTVPQDPGLQPERTRLAWRRTTLSGTVVAVLAGKAALKDGATPGALLAIALCCVLWLGFLYLTHRRIRALAAPSGEPVALSPAHAGAAVLCTVALACCGAVLVL